MMTIYDLVEKYGKGQGEGKMWASVAVMSDALEPMKETDKEGYWCIMRKMYGVMSDGHYNEEFAMYDVSAIEYTGKNGDKKKGGYWSADQVEEATRNFRFPSGVNKWDKYVAFNLMYSDLCKKMDDGQILEAAFAFYFNDEDWPGGSSTKVWDYICCKHNKKSKMK
jgi:hypothetical protein